MKPEIRNPKFKNALEGKAQKVPPIWFMRQAGRYHKHYQALRQKHDFMSLCKVPELAAQVALGPIQDFDFDVSILFSDLLFPLEAMGMKLEYAPGPKFDRHLVPTDFDGLKSVDDALPALQFQAEAAMLTRELLPKEKSLIGFVGGPWTLFSYAVGGSHDGNLIRAKTLLPYFAKFCEKLLPLLVENIQLQLKAGCELVMIFDTSAGELDPATYNLYVAPVLAELVAQCSGQIAYYSKGTQSHHVQTIQSQKGWLGFGFDHRWDISKVLKERSTGFVQGNFDQALLFSSTPHFKEHLERYLDRLQSLPDAARAGWVCGLGHGVLPETPEEHVRFFVKRVRERFG